MISNTCELRTSTTFSLKVSPSTVTRGAAVPAFNSRRRHSRATRTPIESLPTREDHIGMISGLLCAIGEVIGIDPDTVPADEAWREIEEIPFGGGRREHVLRVDVERVEDGRKLVHESDVEIALRVLDHLGCFRDLNRRRLVQASRHDRTVNCRDKVE